VLSQAQQHLALLLLLLLLLPLLVPLPQTGL
jgi:hypothetical protein